MEVGQEAVLNFSKSFSWLDVFVFVCALGDFLVLFAPVLRQIARYLPIVKTQDFASLQKLIPNHRTINSKQLLMLRNRANLFDKFL